MVPLAQEGLRSALGTPERFSQPGVDLQNESCGLSMVLSVVPTLSGYKRSADQLLTSLLSLGNTINFFSLDGLWMVQMLPLRWKTRIILSRRFIHRVQMLVAPRGLVLPMLLLTPLHLQTQMMIVWSTRVLILPKGNQKIVQALIFARDRAFVTIRVV